MTETNVKRFTKCHNDRVPWVIIIGHKTSVGFESLKDDIDAGFIRETDPAYKMEMTQNPQSTSATYPGLKMGSVTDDYNIKIITQRRFIPTELGMEFLRFKML